jgi:hypothetical protein
MWGKDSSEEGGVVLQSVVLDQVVVDLQSVVGRE